MVKIVKKKIAKLGEWEGVRRKHFVLEKQTSI